MIKINPLKTLLGQSLLVFSLPIIAVLAAAFVFHQTSAPVRQIQLAPLAAMPDFVQTAHHDAQLAYRFAAEESNHHLLHELPCYCGCVYMGHENNLDCYLRKPRSEAVTVFDNHAVGCGICVEITLDAMKLWSEGHNLDTIYPFIVETYSARGPSTEDPV